MIHRDHLRSIILGVTCLIVWELIVRLGHTSALVLPAPTVVLTALWRGITSGDLWPHTVHTLTEVVLGLALGSSMGFLGGLLIGESKKWRSILMPFVVTSQVVPKLALAPLFIVWFGFGILPTVVMTALICFFPLLENTSTSMQQVDAHQLELFRMLRATPLQILWRLKLPSGMPNIFAGFRVAVVLAWVGAVVGEFIGSGKGLGALIIAAQGSMDTPLMFAVLSVITALGLIFYKSCEYLEHRVLNAYIDRSRRTSP